jgi:diguanylate cyclase (GGDEF)-like protein
VPGLLLVLTHRADTPARADTPGRTLRLRLGGLPEDAMATLVAEALRAPVADLPGLAAEVHARTAGRPADTLALLNELRAAGTLRVGADGWTWDATALRRHLGEGDTGVRLASLVAALPEPVRDTLSVLSWLGGEATPELLGVACGHPAGAVLEALGPALDNGLAAFTGDAVRLAHERVRQAFPPVGTLGATIARRLARVPDYRGVAAELFLATGPVPEARDLFVEAAATTRVLDPKRSERYLAAALTVADGWDLLPVLLLHADRHAALYRLGRLDDADAEYRWIEENCPNPAGRVPSACLQMVSLAARMRFDAAWALGGDLLDRLDLPIPADPGRSVEPGIAALVGWGDALMSGEVVDTRPENLDEMHQARARLINHMGPMSFLAGPATMAWMQTTAHRLWTTAGPAAPLAVPISAAAFMLIAVRQDYHTGYRINRHLLAECERRGWDLAAAGVRSVFPVSAGHWHERLEDVLPVIRQSFTGLMQFGEMDMAGYLCLAPVGYQLDMASLGALDDEVTAALRLARRTGHAQLTEFMASYRQFVRAMRGETGSPGRLGDDEFDEAAYLAGLSGAPSGNIAYAIRGLAALIFRDAETARASAVEAMARVPAVPGHYQGTMTWVLGALTGVALDEATAWLTARAVDAPGNFSHLAALADAERARRDGDRWAATSRYDTALREVSRRRRPWHYALIAERAADFQLSEGNEYAGMGLLGLARDAYEGWGATAKVQALDQAHPGLRGRRADPDRLHSTSTSPSGALNNSDIDLLGVLDAARTLSSETREAKLRARVGEVLRALTGATDVTLLTGTDTDTGPRSVVRYVQRTRAAVVSEDAVRDDRFAHDPYFAGVARCALLAVPVVARGVDIAVLVLENRSSRDAFTADRLDAVRLVTGQLAVSLENAQLYASLEAKIADRTRELEKANARLEEANARLEQLAVTDPLTGLTNRRRMDTLLDSEWRRAARPKHPLSVAMIDIDHFKGYNDHYGHLGGDRCLTTVAETVAASVRSTDYVARYGGEEFCIILPETPLADALVVAERVRAAVEALREPHALSPQGIVTVSIGVAAGLPGPNGTVDTLLKLADESLYDAKRAGRNRVSTE